MFSEGRKLLKELPGGRLQGGAHIKLKDKVRGRVTGSCEVYIAQDNSLNPKPNSYTLNPFRGDLKFLQNTHLSMHASKENAKWLSATHSQYVPMQYSNRAGVRLIQGANTMSAFLSIVKPRSVRTAPKAIGGSSGNVM